MDVFVVALVLGVMAWSIKTRSERERVMQLAQLLQPYEIEKLMQTLSEGYARALGEDDAQRRLAIWHLLEPAERKLAEQLGQLARDFARLPAEPTRIIALPLPWLMAYPLRLWPQGLARHSVDMRELLQLHARGLLRAAQAEGPSPSSRAYTVLAEMLLMQHSCHWFCKSFAIAGARLLARHGNSHQKVLESVTSATRTDYLALTGRV